MENQIANNSDMEFKIINFNHINLVATFLNPMHRLF